MKPVGAGGRKLVACGKKWFTSECQVHAWTPPLPDPLPVVPASWHLTSHPAPCWKPVQPLAPPFAPGCAGAAGSAAAVMAAALAIAGAAGTAASADATMAAAATAKIAVVLSIGSP